MVPPEVRFWKKVDTSGKCWLWTAGLNNKGYGMFYPVTPHGDRRRPGVLAHRYAWELKHGPIAPGLAACHRCDNPLCVRPEHVFLGTQADNLADARAKGRVRHDRLGRWIKLV